MAGASQEDHGQQALKKSPDAKSSVDAGSYAPHPQSESPDNPPAAAGGSGTTHGAHDPLDPDHLVGHVQDADHFQLPRMFSRETHGKVKIPQFRKSNEPIMEIKTTLAQLDELIEPLDLKVTKFMVLEVVSALVIAALFIPLAQRAKGGQRPRGRLWNMLEALVVFIRDQVARPTIGSHDADRFAPFIMTLFVFVLGCNLLGMVPWAGSPTAALGTTGALAMITLITVIVAGSLKMGPIGFWTGQVPEMDLPWFVAILLKPMFFGIEVLGILIKHFVLAMRLLANMMAGHIVLSVLIAFISTSAGTMAFLGVVPASLLGATALSVLELFVSFLQAYIFAFLSGLFIGMAVHPH